VIHVFSFKIPVTVSANNTVIDSPGVSNKLDASKFMLAMECVILAVLEL
jgi:hypothetical protein